MRSLPVCLLALLTACTGASSPSDDDDGGSGGGGLGGGVGGGEEGGGIGGDPVDDDGDGYDAEEDCDDSDAEVHPGATEVAGNGKDDDCDPSTCLTQDFASTRTEWGLPARWTLGDSWNYFDSTSSGGSCGSASGYSDFSTFDLTGDGKADLVETYHCDEDEVSKLSWWVYENTGSAFSPTRTEWTLPTRWSYGGAWDRFDSTSSGGSCGSSSGYSDFSLVDLTGDGKVDLVETYHCDEDTVGLDTWWVYENTGSGFSATRTEWSLPTRWSYGGAWDRFDSISSGGSCGSTSGYSDFVLMDITGDSKPDLVETYHCDQDTVGLDTWWVYENTGSGFSATRSEWVLPPRWSFGGAWDRYDTTASGGSCGSTSGYSDFSTMDLDGDGLLDLVETFHCEQDTVGLETWWLYKNTGSAFATTRTEWSLPSRWSFGGAWDHYDSVSSGGSCGSTSGYSDFVLMDLDANGAPDLVETFHCEQDSVGLESWWLYKNTGSGFSTTRTEWALPSRWSFGGAWDHYDSTSSGGSCGTTSGYSDYSAMDLDGDGALDLVETYHCSEDTVGLETWWAYKGQCDE